MALLGQEALISRINPTKLKYFFGQNHNLFHNNFFYQCRRKHRHQKLKSLDARGFIENFESVRDLIRQVFC